MSQQETPPVASAQTVAPKAQEFYFPIGSGTDPDFHVPRDAERIHGGRFFRWLLRNAHR